MRHVVGKFYLVGCFLSMIAAAPAFAAEPVKVVYHFTEGLEQSSRGLNNIRNHLQADPTAKIVVVSNGEGVAAVMDGAKGKNNQLLRNTIRELTEKGVEFRACQNTLTSRDLDLAKVIAEAKMVTSGVAEVARLQSKEGYVYLKP